MAGTIKIPTIDVSDGKLLLGEQDIAITDGTPIEITPLAAVPESASADTVIVVKDGVPKQTPVSDLLAPVTTVQDAVDELTTKLSGKVGRLAVDVSGIAVTTDGGSGYYYSGEITVNLPSGAVPISASWYGIFDSGTFPQIRDNNKIIFQSNHSVTLGSPRTVIVGYYIP